MIIMPFLPLFSAQLDLLTYGSRVPSLFCLLLPCLTVGDGAYMHLNIRLS